MDDLDYRATVCKAISDLIAPVDDPCKLVPLILASLNYWCLLHNESVVDVAVMIAGTANNAHGLDIEEGE